MRLSQSHDQSNEFNRLTRVKSNHFLFSFNEVSRFDDSGHGFDRLTRVIFYVLF